MSVLRNRSKYNKVQRENIAQDKDQILDLLLELRKSSDQDKVTRATAEQTEILAAGRKGTASDSAVWRGPNDPEVPQAVLENTALVWASIMTQDRPGIWATAPNADDITAVAAAEFTTRLIEHVENEEDLNHKWHKTAIWAALHGTAAMKAAWDAKNEKVTIEPMSIFNVFMQNANHTDNVNWVYFRDYLDTWDAKELLAPFDDGTDNDPAEEEYSDGIGIKRYGVPKYEIWYKPCFRFPTGLYACVVNDTVVEAIPYPFVFKDGGEEEVEVEVEGENGEVSVQIEMRAKTKAMLPCVWWKCRENREATLGYTPWFQAAVLQRKLNKLNSIRVKTAEQSFATLFIDKAFMNEEAWDKDNRVIVYDTVDGKPPSAPEWFSPPPLDPQQISECDALIKRIYDTVGLNPSTGGDIGSNQSGKAIAYGSKLDTDKHADAFKSLQVAQKDLTELYVKCFQTFPEKPIEIPVDGGSAISFMSSDIAGVKVRLEPRSSNESLTAAKLENSKMDIANGFASPESLSEIQPTLETAGMRSIIEEQIEAFTSGIPIDLTAEDAPPGLVVAVVDERIARAILERDNENVMALRQFKKMYMQMLAVSPMGPEQVAEAKPSGGSAPQNQNTPTPLKEKPTNESSLVGI